MAEIVRNSDFDALFLDLSQHLNDLIKALAEGAPLESFLERIKELALVPEPMGSWEYEFEPILLAVRGILNRKPKLELYCYKQPYFDRLSAEVAANLARLVLRASMTEKIDVDEWRINITQLLDANTNALNEEAEYIAKKSYGKETCICISGINGRTLRDCLLERNLKATLTYLVLPYHFTPIEILTREIEREIRDSSMDHNKLYQIIKCHVKFVREYVLTSRNYDEAYLRWVKDTAPWMKYRFYMATLMNGTRYV
ncbi:MAG: hypothetical protein QXH91_06590 [Candidatus Bathyarchaeia archaeon]